MAEYRGVVRHVKYWRGQLQRWSTVYPFYGSLTRAFSTADAMSLLTADDAMCYGQTASDGGTYECDLYNVATGGIPVVTYVRFDYASPSSWIEYSAAGWGSSRPTAYVVNVAEAALSVTWPAGLSKTGKPVKFRKWYHAVPESSVAGNTADLTGAQVTALTNQATALQGVFSSIGLSLGNARTSAGTPTVNPFYENHQMPRGRRRKALVSADGTYSGPHVTIPSLPPVTED